MTTTAKNTMSAKEVKNYKGGSIYEVQDASGNKGFVIIGTFTKVFKSVADAKRYIDGEECTYRPYNAKYIELYAEMVQTAKAQYRTDYNVQPATPAMSEEQYKNKRIEILDARIGLLEDIKERVNEFVADMLKGYGDFKATHISDSRIEISLMNGEKAEFGCGWDVYIKDNFYGEHKPRIECNIGTCGSFEIGTGDNQEIKYVAFARFITMLKECGMEKYLLRTHTAIKALSRQLSQLEDEYKLIQLNTL